MHKRMAEVLDEVSERIKDIKYRKTTKRPAWPIIILRTPKGWTGPKEIDGKQIEGSFRSHQVPIIVDENHKENLELLEEWLKSYKPEELFDENGTLNKELQELAPIGNQRMGANPNANGGLLLKELNLPDFREYGVKITEHGKVQAQDMIELGKYLKDVIKLNKEQRY
jgi:xylulose-5-phosphate/fructose-6-phosphate phosphoketolase